MEFWSDKYVNKRWTFPVKGGDKYNMCLPFILKVLHDEKGFDVSEKDNDEVYSASPDWYKKAEVDLINKARKYGKLIKNAKDLKEWDVIFLRIDGEIRHCGVMIDNYGRFLHQRKKFPACVDKITSKNWKDNFFVGIRWLNG